MRTPVPSVDLRPDHWAIVRSALRQHVPDREVLAFGSRATWTAKDYSDLDLAVMGDGPLSLRTVSALDEALGDSDLPFKVDVVDWARTDEAFRAIIRRSAVSVQVPTMTPATAGRVKVPSATRVAAAPLSCAWREVAIGEIADIVGGGTPSTKNAKNFGGSIPWLTPRDLSGTHDRYIENGERNLSRRGLDGSSAKLLPVGAVLLSTRAPIGYVALAKNPIATNQGFRSLVVRDGILPEFLYYWLKVNTEELERYASGSTFRELSGSSLKDIRLDLPPTDEQRSIAHILGTLDDKIELNRRMNETLEAMARALFKSWFVDFAPVRAQMEGRNTGLPQDIADLFPDRLVDSEMGEIPEGWEVSQIGSEVDAVGGSTPSTKEPSYWHQGDHYWATPKDLSKLSSPVLLDTTRKITNAGLRKISSRTLPVGTVLLSSRAPIGYLAIAEIPTAVNQGFIAMKCERRLPNLYVLYWCEQNLGYIRDIAGGSTFAEISKKTFRTVSVVVPSKAILVMYQRLSRPLYDLLVANVKEAVTLAALRDTLLPKLISGEIRLPDAERALESAT